ncbi:hypothetical protein [Saccharopolyspora cebuensis]|uniref:DUF1542 domain-containing protein n=1 Tax=Saccharopolyspora cebuensis TaxID=418759 RepID=A0ABV4CL77_9PSEU
MEALIVIVLAALVIVGGLWWARRAAAAKHRRELDDARAEARRWVERLGGQVLTLTGTNDAARQALADASERHQAALSQLDQTTTTTRAELTTGTALEGLYYIRAARTAMDLDPGPELPELAGRRGAGQVTEYRDVEVDGEREVASPTPTERTPYYYPGGPVAGRPVPEGWYSRAWWQPALVAGAWGLGTLAVTSALFSGMAGVPAEAHADDLDGTPGDAEGGLDDLDFGGFDFGGF